MSRKARFKNESPNFLLQALEILSLILRKEHIALPDYQYWTISLLDFNIYLLGCFALDRLRNLCSTFFFFITWKTWSSGEGVWRKSLWYPLCYRLQCASAGSESTWQCERQLASLRIHYQKSTARDRHSDLAGSIVQALLWQRRWCLAALRWTRSQLTGSPCKLLSFTLHTDVCLFFLHLFSYLNS